jgi:hypothetical protein
MVGMGNLEAGRRGAYVSFGGSMTSKTLDTTLDALLTAGATSSDAEIKRLAEHVQKQRKPRSRGRPKAALPTLEEAMLPGSAEAFAVWCGLHSRRHTGKVYLVDGEPVAITRPCEESETAISRVLADQLEVSYKTVTPLVRAICARLAPPKVPEAVFVEALRLSLADQIAMAHKSGKK